MKVLFWVRRVLLVYGAWALASVMTVLARHRFVTRGIVWSKGGPVLEHVVSTYYQSLWALIAGVLCGVGIETRRPALTGVVLAGLALAGNAASLAFNPAYRDALPHSRLLVLLACFIFVLAYISGFGLQQLVLRREAASGGADAP